MYVDDRSQYLVGDIAGQCDEVGLLLSGQQPVDCHALLFV
jgi:hypothetical protein